MYKFYEDYEGHHVRTIDDEYVFCAEKREKAEEIVAALEKQIPKKVNYKTYESNNGGLLTQNKFELSCPICGDKDTIFDINGDGLNYCGECGQLLDWE